MANKNSESLPAVTKKVKRGPFFYVGLLVLICLSAVGAHFVQSPYGENCRVYTVTVLLEADRDSILELYYDTGRGFYESDHQEMKITGGAKNLKLEFTVPVWKQFTQMRIDPVGSSVKMKVHEIAVASDDGSFSHRVSLENISPVSQIKDGHWSGSYYSFETVAEATDPTLLIEEINDPHVQLRGKSFSVYALWICAALFAMLSGNWIYRFFILGL